MQVAAAVARAAFECGVSGLEHAPDDWHEYICSRMWWPEGRTTRLSGVQERPRSHPIEQ